MVSFLLCINIPIDALKNLKTKHMHTHFYTNMLVLKYAVILSQSLYMTPV